MMRQVTSGLLFYPRGGSAQVVRYLRRALATDGWSVPLAVGSLGGETEQSNASAFFGPDQLHIMDYTTAIEAYEAQRDPIAAPVPLHPSYEDRPNAPDRIFTAVSPALSDHLTAAWRELLDVPDVAASDLFHLHHLTPQHAAVAHLWPEKPIIGHLHGTEMKMIENIQSRREIARTLGADLAIISDREWEPRQLVDAGLRPDQIEIFETTNWDNWRYGDFWESQMRDYVRHCRRLFVISPHDRDLALELFGDDAPEVEWIPNGVDIGIFDRIPYSDDEKLELLRRWFVDDPQGWDERGVPGQVRYSVDDLQYFVDSDSGKMNPVLLYVGRFLDFKRVPLLIRAYQRAREHFDTAAPLIVWGGSPGEWEADHPHSVAQQGGDEGIFFAGWRGHDDLPAGLNCADLMVAPSYHEPFGQVYLEAMATGVPVVATRTGGPLSFVNTEEGKPNGWLVDPDDEDALAAVLIEAVNNRFERRRRAVNAYEQIRRSYSWTTLARRFERAYEREIERESLAR